MLDFEEMILLNRYSLISALTTPTTSHGGSFARQLMPGRTQVATVARVDQLKESQYLAGPEGMRYLELSKNFSVHSSKHQARTSLGRKPFI